MKQTSVTGVAVLLSAVGLYMEACLFWFVSPPQAEAALIVAQVC